MYIGTFKDDDSGANIEVFWEFVNPVRAAEWIKTNSTLNRHLNRTNIDKIARDLETGYWNFNGSTVCFDWDGVMIDAQHRCHAIVESGVGVNMLVLRGLDPDAMKIMGQDLPRSTRDILKTTDREISNTTIAVSMAGMIAQLSSELGDVKTKPRLADYTWANADVFSTIGGWAKQTIAKSNLFIDPRHAYSNGKSDKRAATASALSTLFYVMTVKHGGDEDSVRTFWEDIFSGMSSKPAARNQIDGIRRYLSSRSPMLRIGGGSSTASLLVIFDALIRSYNRWLTDSHPSPQVVEALSGGRVLKTLGDLTRTRHQ